MGNWMTGKRWWQVALVVVVGVAMAWAVVANTDDEDAGCAAAEAYVEHLDTAVARWEPETVPEQANQALAWLMANDPPHILDGYYDMWVDTILVLLTQSPGTVVGTPEASLTTAFDRIEGRYAEDVAVANATCPNLAAMTAERGVMPWKPRDLGVLPRSTPASERSVATVTTARCSRTASCSAAG
jgi:hypothetical protein